MSCHDFDESYRYSFSNSAILQARDSNKLLTLELELTHECNYACKYCYSLAGKKLDKELSYPEVCEAVDQAQNLGVQTIVIIGGGEPLLYPHLKELIVYIYSKQIRIILFTNGSLLSKEMAAFIKSHDVFPVVKINGMQPKIINWLCGNKGAYKNIIKAISYLQYAGYMKEKNGIGISTIICRQNYDDIVPLWRWVRNNNFIPYFERLSPQGRALKYDIQLSAYELKNIFSELSEIDQNDYNIQWDVNIPPIAGSSCNRHYYSIYIKANGDVIPCSGIDISVGNIKNVPLQNILMESKVIQELRHIDTKKEGKCKDCSIDPLCYGCRGNAYQVNNDYLSEDPFCWYDEKVINNAL
ncbi:MAG: radical SAM protein [Lachnospiraceae bacterium]|nr:radical SAM protein [Lachnospiraceae bacterium]